jgi:hypothetical protein
LGFLLAGFIPESFRDFGTGGNIRYKEKDVAENNERRSAFEARIEELITQCKDIPVGEVLQLLHKTDSNQDIDVEQKLKELSEKYHDKG